MVNLYAFCRLKPIPNPENPRLTSKHVTVVIPSLEGGGDELVDTIQSILVTEPFEIILVTIEANEERAKSMIKQMGTTKVRVCCVKHPNKRRQMVRAIPEIKTEITVFADDDVAWPPKLLRWMLAPLENEKYGPEASTSRITHSSAEDLGLPWCTLSREKKFRLRCLYVYGWWLALSLR